MADHNDESQGKPSRRELIRQAGLLGASLYAPFGILGCKTPGAAVGSALRDAPAAAGAVPAWLAQVDAILPAVLPHTDFTGDKPRFAHQNVRDASPDLESGAANETAGVVIVGGGIAGLAAAYLLADKKPILIEQAPNFGGNSRGESWQGIEYSIGAAYLVKPEADDPLMTTFYKPIGVADQWRVSQEGEVGFGGKLYKKFWEGSTVEDATGKAQVRRIHDYVKSVAASSYPDIPPEGEVPQTLKDLDNKTFLEVLQAAAGGTLHPHVRALLEHYCWSSLGGTLDELSAAAGLNFLAGEEEGICALPGGNAKVASALLRSAHAGGIPEANFRAGTIVVKVAKRPDGVRVQCVKADGSKHVIDAKAVIMACPKYVAKRIVDDVSEAQATAWESIAYRGYLVANALLDQPIALDQYDIYMLGDTSETFEDARKAADKQKVTDVILGHWAKGSGATKSVLTLYRGFPYEGARSRLLKPAAFAQYRKEFADQMPEILQTLGVQGTVPEDKILVTRWGHPLCLAAKGLIADGTVTKGHAPIDDKIFFCNQDDWALPAIETCLSRAITVAKRVREVVA